MANPSSDFQWADDNLGWVDLAGAGDWVGDLFGSSKEWQPYIDDNGNWVWKNPNRANPVPVANIPGAQRNPSKTYRQTAGQIQAFQDLFPYFARTLASQIIPQQQAELEAARQTSEPYAQLMTELFKKFGPQLNQIGNEINLQNMLAQASNENAVLQGPGGELVRSAMELQRLQDPEFFSTRELTSSRLADLMNSIDLSGALSSNERREIGQGLAQEGEMRGTANAPSNVETVGNAMRYGQAGRNREMQSKGALSAAIQQANNFLPASRTGTDVFQVATGRPSSNNQGANKFTGVNATGGQTFNTLAGLGSNMQNNQNSLQQANNQIASQEKDWLDQFVQFTQGLSNVTSSVGSLAGMAGMCWVAREVFGADNPKWMLFRKWLIEKAPTEFRDMYLTYGPAIAEYIKDKPVLKEYIKLFMLDKILEVE